MTAVVQSQPVAYEMSIEVLDGDFPAWLWAEAHGDSLIEAALDAVPDRFSGLLIYRGRGGASAPREPRRPRPFAGAGAAALEFPGEWVFEPVPEPPRTARVPAYR